MLPRLSVTHRMLSMLARRAHPTNTTTSSSSSSSYASQAKGDGSPAAGAAPATIMIWGATGGIGSALSRRLQAAYGSSSRPATRGSVRENTVQLVLVAEHRERLQALQQELGGGVDVIAADARDPGAVEAAVDQAVRAHGGARLVGVASCIGNVDAASALATDLDHFKATLEVNLITSFNIIKASVRAMLSTERAPHGHKQQQQPGSGSGGAIVFTSAALASHGLPNYEAMSAAKAGVEGLARSAAATYAPHHICINCVAPGLTATPPTAKFTGDTLVADASRQMHPLKQLATADEVAAALEFFLRPDVRGGVITGQVLAVDGGLSMLHPHHAGDYSGV